MDKDVRARVYAVVPLDQPGGPYKENEYWVIPIKVNSVEFNPDYQDKSGENPAFKAGIECLQEILVQHDMGVVRGSSLSVELDMLALGGVLNWVSNREQGQIIRTKPYAVNVRYERPHWI